MNGFIEAARRHTEVPSNGRLQALAVRRRTALLEPSAVTLDEYATEWWALYAHPNLTPRTVAGYHYLWDAHVSPTLGGVPLAELTPLAFERWKAALLVRGVGPQTVRRTMIMLQGALQRAVEWELLVSNPIRHVRKPAPNRRRFVRPLAPEVVEQMRMKLLGSGQLRDATLLTILAYAGLRPGEALALSWGAIASQTLLIEHAAALGQLKTTKTGRTRTVRIVQPLADDINTYRGFSSAVGSELVFPSATGELWSDHTWRNWRRRVFQPIARSVGASGARPYDLRHSFVSLMIAEGRSIVDIARQAGHSASMALDTYGHIFDGIDHRDRRTAEQRIIDARRAILTRHRSFATGTAGAVDL